MFKEVEHNYGAMMIVQVWANLQMLFSTNPPRCDFGIETAPKTKLLQDCVQAQQYRLDKKGWPDFVSLHSFTSTLSFLQQENLLQEEDQLLLSAY